MLLLSLGVTASDQPQTEHSVHEYEVRYHVDIKQETNKYISGQQLTL
jgi:hypothetical protein